MKKDARFYFANLTADIARCAHALATGDQERYVRSRILAYATLEYLRQAKRPEAFEEGILLFHGLHHARELGTLGPFSDYVARLGQEYSPLVRDSDALPLTT